MELNRIIEMIRSALIESPTSFEEVANGRVKGVNWTADRMPESWIVSRVMLGAQNIGLAAIPEVRVRHDLQWFESGGEKINPDKLSGLKKGGAKIDLLLGEKSSLGEGLLRLRVAMEIKGPKSNWQQFQADIERLHQLKDVVNGEDQALIFAYVTCPLLETEQKACAQKFEQATGLERTRFDVHKALQRSLVTTGVCWTYVYMHIIPGKG